MEPIVIAAFTFLGSGAFVTILTAVLKYKVKFRADETDADELLMSRQDRTILELTNENKAQDRYVIQLQNALVNARAKIPERKD